MVTALFIHTRACGAVSTSIPRCVLTHQWRIDTSSHRRYLPAIGMIPRWYPHTRLGLPLTLPSPTTQERDVVNVRNDGSEREKGSFQSPVHPTTVALFVWNGDDSRGDGKYHHDPHCEQTFCRFDHNTSAFERYWLPLYYPLFR